MNIKDSVQMKEFIIKILKDADSSDDLNRAKFAFRNHSKEDMNKPYGESDTTPAEIIASYEEANKKIDAAIAWIQNI